MVLGLSALIHAEVALPQLSAPVTDMASMISPKVENQLNQKLTALWENKGNQIAVLTLPSLEGEPIESISIRIVNKWQLGTAKKDNGILLLISRDDRKLRIEVGQGLEGKLTDAYASRIIRNIITPLFKKGNFDAGVVSGVAGILSYTDPNYLLEPIISDEQRLALSSGSQIKIELYMAGIAILICLILVYLSEKGVNFGGSTNYDYDFYSGGGSYSSSSSSSFGGFSGSGGGFSGGGASGGW